MIRESSLAVGGKSVAGLSLGRVALPSVERVARLSLGRVAWLSVERV